MGFRELWQARRGRIATIDAVKAAPPPSPLAPIDLTDTVQIAGVMTIAARIGDLLLSSGTSNRDTVAQIHAVTSAYGLHYCHVDITLNTITIFATIGVEHRVPVSVFRVVGTMTTNFSKLSAVDRLIRSIQAGATPPELAEKILDELESAPSPYGLGLRLLGWGGLGASGCILLGGGALAAVVSFLIAITIMAGSYWLDKLSLPVFFQDIFCGFMATVPAAITFSLAAARGMHVPPGHIVASGIIVMLAGLTLVQSLQDGITGAPVTASSRFFETLLLTGAIVAGVGLGIQFSQILGISLPPIDVGGNAPNYASSLAKTIAGALAAASFALACSAERLGIVVSGATALLGSFLYYFLLIPSGMGQVVATAIAAGVIGLAGGLMSRRFLIPPLITAIAGITPMLPGLALYRGMYAALNDQMLVGFSYTALALSLCCALAAGVVFGEWVARRLRRPPKLNLYTAFRRPRRSPFPSTPSTDTSSFRVVDITDHQGFPAVQPTRAKED